MITVPDAVVFDPQRVTVSGGWVFQGDGHGEITRESAPGETQAALRVRYRFDTESQVHVALNVRDVTLAMPFRAVSLDVHA